MGEVFTFVCEDDLNADLIRSVDRGECDDLEFFRRDAEGRRWFRRRMYPEIRSVDVDE